MHFATLHLVEGMRLHPVMTLTVVILLIATQAGAQLAGISCTDTGNLVEDGLSNQCHTWTPLWPVRTE